MEYGYRAPEISPEGWITNNCLKSFFKKVGKNVKVSPFASFYGHENVEIGDNVRIDHGNLFLVASGSLKIGSHVHLAANGIYSCGGGIEIHDHVQVGFAAQLISASDDVGGDYLIGPTYDESFRNITTSRISLGRLSLVLAQSIVLPGTTLYDGAALAPLSQTRTRQILEGWTLYGGVPCQKIKYRNKKSFYLAAEFEGKYLKQNP